MVNAEEKENHWSVTETRRGVASAFGIEIKGAMFTATVLSRVFLVRE